MTLRVCGAVLLLCAVFAVQKRQQDRQKDRIAALQALAQFVGQAQREISEKRTPAVALFSRAPDARTLCALNAQEAEQWACFCRELGGGDTACEERRCAAFSEYLHQNLHKAHEENKLCAHLHAPLALLGGAGMILLLW